MSRRTHWPVNLTLEESGALCHLIIRELAINVDADMDNTNELAAAANAAFLRGLATAHAKISAANDKLMETR